MIDENILPQSARKFLRSLSWGLAILTPQDREDVLDEIRAHLIEVVAAGQDVDETIAGFGPPELYARNLVENYDLTRAVGGARVMPAARVLAARMTRSLLTAAIALLIAIPGLFVLTSLFLAFAKLTLPNQVGLWMGTDVFVLGMVDTPSETTHELLGICFIPLILAFGGLNWLIARAGLLAWARRAAHAGDQK
jgi:uncharacterized membrane protein